MTLSAPQLDRWYQGKWVLLVDNNVATWGFTESDVKEAARVFGYTNPTIVYVEKENKNEGS
jgi:hypothetical protein